MVNAVADGKWLLAVGPVSRLKLDVYTQEAVPTRYRKVAGIAIGESAARNGAVTYATRGKMIAYAWDAAKHGCEEPYLVALGLRAEDLGEHRCSVW